MSGLAKAMFVIGTLVTVLGVVMLAKREIQNPELRKERRISLSMDDEPPLEILVSSQWLAYITLTYPDPDWLRELAFAL